MSKFKKKYTNYIINRKNFKYKFGETKYKFNDIFNYYEEAYSM